MDIATIGGGIAGLFSSLKLTNSHCNVDIYEEHDKIGYPKHCTGLISESTLNMLGEIGRECAATYFSSISFDFFGKEKVLLMPKYKVVHLDRVCLERKIAEAILDAGGRIYLGKKASLAGNRNVKLGEDIHQYDHVIIAEGIRMKISRVYLDELKLVKKIFGLNVVVQAKNNLEEIKVGFHPKIAKGFFYWIFPLSNEKILVGLGTKEPFSINTSIKKILEIYGINAWKEIERYGGWIGLGPPASRQNVNSITFLGDSFGLQKPLTGGGIYPIVKSASNIEGKNCEESLKLLRKNTVIVSRELRNQVMIGRLIQSNWFPQLVRFITPLNRIEIKDTEGIFDYDRHELILPNLLFKIKHLKKELKISI